jgi:hypothetical protein
MMQGWTGWTIVICSMLLYVCCMVWLWLRAGGMMDGERKAGTSGPGPAVVETPSGVEAGVDQAREACPACGYPVSGQRLVVAKEMAEKAWMYDGLCK